MACVVPFSSTEQEVLARIQDKIKALAPSFPGDFEPFVLPLENSWTWTDGSIVVVDISDFNLEAHLQIRYVNGEYRWERGETGSDNGLLWTSKDVSTVEARMEELVSVLTMIWNEEKED